jgi:H+/Na+-translocating ferredoxin:NAD+ oxidoreductase subunit G
MSEIVSPPRSPVWPMFRAMVGIGVLAGALIVTAFQATKTRIEHNKAVALERAILHVLPGAASHSAFAFEDGKFRTMAAGGQAKEVVHAGFDAQGQLVGFAIEAEGMGYQDTIRLLYGYSPAKEELVGFEVLESKETPGLGDKINSDAGFHANFEHLAVALDRAATALEHPIEAVKHGEKHDPWQVDGITGATVSSKAVAAILQRSVSLWAPRLRARLGDFHDGGEP